MWKFTSKSITETLRQSNNIDPEPRKAPHDSSEDGTLLRTTREEGLECPVCWESFNVMENVPYVMWCGHTICKYCLVGLQRAVVKFQPLPFQIPFFVACPWCNLLSLRLVYNGIIKFPSKNYYLLWMVEGMNGYRSKSRRDSMNTPSLCCRRDGNDMSEPSDSVPDELSLNSGGGWDWIIEFFRTRRLHDSLRESVAVISHLFAKFPLIVVSLLMALYAIPASSTVLGLYILLTFALAVPSFLVLYFAFLSLNCFIREIAS
ncbi:PREDICTED: uncharacterized protein LOC104812096 [Tarenaya hassleriana]|uniref:uncharacterized protein LOC104812096 n=1 Tax=Tarenaya hassleriana TaxID=28532 RepID=UPI00053C6D73|nr:PREDICTED: uncharacterized protein LOC104812096 [Tarenaya hassleriana]